MSFHTWHRWNGDRIDVEIIANQITMAELRTPAKSLIKPEMFWMNGEGEHVNTKQRPRFVPGDKP